MLLLKKRDHSLYASVGMGNLKTDPIPACEEPSNHIFQWLSVLPGKPEVPVE